MYDFSQFPTITTERLLLRELRIEDAEDVLLFRGDPYVQRFNSEPLQTVAEAEQFIEEMHAAHPHDYLIWGLTLHDSDVVMGAVGLGSWNKYHRRAEIGYDLAQRYWGNGFATEAAQAVLGFGFEQLNLNRIYARTIADNHESTRLLERVGFTLEGVQRGYSWEDDGTFHDSAIYAILRDEFLTPSAAKPNPAIASTSTKEVKTVTVLQAKAGEIGRALWRIEAARGRLLESLDTLDEAMLDWKLNQEANSIGSLLYHIALIELDWLFVEVLERPFPPHLTTLFPKDVRDGDGRLSHIAGHPLPYYLERLTAVRQALLQAFATMTLDDFRRLRTFDPYDVSPEWVLFHLTQHDTEHRGHIQMLITLFRRENE